MSIVRGIIGLAFIFALGWLISFDRKNVRYKQMFTMIGVQLIITFLALNTTIGIKVLAAISDFFGWLMEQAQGGINFVFGGIVFASDATVFFFHVLMPIVFVSALLGILNYINVLPFIIKWTGWLINKITGMGTLESYFAPSTAILGQPEVFITIKERIPKLHKQQMYTICASAMSAVSAATLAAYMTMVPGKYVVVAVFLNIFSALIISCIVNPYDPKKFEQAEVESIGKMQGETVGIVAVGAFPDVKKIEKEPFFQMLGNYIWDGFKLVITVSAMLIGFIGLVTLLNNSFINLFDISFTEIIGWVFAPIAFLLGVPWDEVVQVGSIMATKLITNEFVAMGEFAKVSEMLSPKAQAMISTYLISFANFGTLGIVSGSIKSISEKQGNMVAKYAFKLLIGATMASMLTATIVGMFY